MFTMEAFPIGLSKLTQIFTSKVTDFLSHQSTDLQQSFVGVDQVWSDGSAQVSRKPGKLSLRMYAVLVTAFVAFSLSAGYMAGTQPPGAGWRFFSWHPFLMTCGMMGLFGTGILTKKLKGYTNTKLHGIMAMSGAFLSLGGIYCIYLNKESMGRKHLQTAHAILGISVAVGCLLVGIVGSVFLHPDFGIDTNNKTIRMAHTFAARFLVMLGWFAAFLGLNELTNDTLTLFMFALPLVVLFPFTLM